MASNRASEASATSAERADPDMRMVLQALQTMGGKPIETLSAQEAREQPTPADAAMQVMRQRGITQPPLDIANVEDRTISGDAGPIPIRIYTPDGNGPFPVVVYYHGGGWVIADLDTYDASARALAHHANAIVVSAHYRQGPEHKFPAAHEDAFKAYQWAVANAQALGGDPSRIAVVGESAGGNLAMNVAMQARNTGTTQPVHEVLVYPVAGTDVNTASYQENANAKPLNKPMMEWFFRQYLNGPGDFADPRINLIAADLKGLPPTTIIGAEIDPLRSEGVTLAQRLEAAGVPVTYQLYDGVTHEFFGMGAVVDDALDAEELAGMQLQRAFGTVDARTD
ncbi:MAG TPA: alpha/beta hydrolase [Geminicoccus sp.]|uniref:alpha/beta hydrolase n=1 Tax=Geminicoccus sp. TaxID=2024832 RepID=UPI002E32EC33|nr:alpha/beta hydrolase [Geminicoccus sp.]HEX2524770.1 alpha/beta hydrolase [Geminicoccus sp.]